MPTLLLRRLGGGALLGAAIWTLTGPLAALIRLGHPVAAMTPKMLTGLTYQITLGLMLGLIGVYLLTRKPTPKI